MCDSTATIIAGVIGFVGALIGAAATIIAVRLTINSNSKQQKQDLINQAKPIIINIDYDELPSEESKNIQRIILFCDNNDNEIALSGTFKNTNNAIMFFDYVKTEKNTYTPKISSVVDRDTIFQIGLKLVRGEVFESWEIFFHDIYGNNYKYIAKINSEYDNRLELENSEPIRIKKEK